MFIWTETFRIWIGRIRCGQEVHWIVAGSKRNRRYNQITFTVLQIHPHPTEQLLAMCIKLLRTVSKGFSLLYTVRSWIVDMSTPFTQIESAIYRWSFSIIDCTSFYSSAGRRSRMGAFCRCVSYPRSDSSIAIGCQRSLWWQVPEALYTLPKEYGVVWGLSRRTLKASCHARCNMQRCRHRYKQ